MIQEEYAIEALKQNEKWTLYTTKKDIALANFYFEEAAEHAEYTSVRMIKRIGKVIKEVDL